MNLILFESILFLMFIKHSYNVHKMKVNNDNKKLVLLFYLGSYRKFTTVGGVSFFKINFSSFYSTLSSLSHLFVLFMKIVFIFHVNQSTSNFYYYFWWLNPFFLQGISVVLSTKVDVLIKHQLFIFFQINKIDN